MAIKLNGSTSGSVALDAPADTSPSGTDVTLTLPTSAGSSGQYLQTNGSGTLSWQTVATGGLQSVQVFTSSGTWTKPAGINKIKVIVTGGGGGGGTGTGSDNGGGGGGAGGTAIEIIDVSSVSSVTVTVGLGGAGGTTTSTNDATDGGTSSFGTYCSATGGGEGYHADEISLTDSGDPGVGSGGDINLSGGWGGGQSGGAADGAVAGIGGASFWGGGGRQSQKNRGAATNGEAYGSGGGGGVHSGTTETAGGDGAGGVVYVEEYA